MTNHIFTAWGEDGVANTLVRGEKPPAFHNGTLLPDCPDLIWTIKAESWDDAVAQYEKLQGYDDK